MPFLHAHRRRVPAQDVDRSIVVGMGAEAEPALVEDASVETGFLPHHPARFFNRASRRGRHVADAQIFANNGPKAFGDIKRRPAMPIAADSRELALRVALPLPRCCALCGTATAIDANRRANVRWSDVLDLTSEADMPAKGIAGDDHILGAAAQEAGVAELYPANLERTDSDPPAVQLPDLDLTTLKAEAVVDAFLARQGIADDALEEVGERLVEIAQGLLLAGLQDDDNPIVLRTQRRQFAGLGSVVQAAAGIGFILAIPVPALFKPQIVDKATDVRELPERALLFSAIRKGRHVVYALHAHLVFVTKYRRDAPSELAIRDLSRIFAKICQDFRAERIECNGEGDHVDLLIVYPPKVALSKLVNGLKGASSRLLREWRPEVRGRYKDGAFWSPSHFVASCGGDPLTIIAEYVKSQREAPSGRSRLPPRPEGRGFSRGN